jgi:drug/metabolite transporter (DMT)-like permease
MLYEVCEENRSKNDRLSAISLCRHLQLVYLGLMRGSWHNAQPMKKKTSVAVLALLASILSWSSIPLFLKHFTESLDAWTVNATRYGIASLLLLPALRAAPPPVAGNLPTLWRAALVPALVNSLGQIGWALIPYYVSASVMGFGIRASFLFTIFGSLWLLPEERYLLGSLRFWTGGILCVTGMFTLFWGSLRQSVASVPGLLILFGSAAVWGFYGISVRKFLRGYPPHRSFAVISLYTATVLLLLMLLFGRVSALVELAPATLGLIALSAVLGIALAHVLMFYVLGHLGAIIESGAEMATPFLTFCGAALIFREHLSALQWIGGIGVIAGCTLMLSSHRPQPDLAVTTDALGLD